MMRKIVLLMILFLVLGCGIKVNYIVKNTATPSVVNKIKTSKIGVIIIGDAISGLYDVIKTEVSRYQGNQADIQEIEINDGQLAKLKSEEFCKINWNNYEISFLIVLYQYKPKIEKYFSRISEGDERIDNHKGYYIAKKDGRVYSTTISVKCNIFFYDIENQSLIAKSVEEFSHTEEKYFWDTFSDHTLFGFVEDFFKSAGPDENKYPDLKHLDAITTKNYFFSFLKGIEK
jgi:hypothetical protein